MAQIAVGADWEKMWAPYDEATYSTVLQHISPKDIVLEIGAGDFRLARRLSLATTGVYAIERQKVLLEDYAVNLPANCYVIDGDARKVPFPAGITTAVLLMRHCRHLACYWRKLTAISCQKLITNARWGMGVEIIDLKTIRRPFQTIKLGWYACWCGGTGFVPGDATTITDRVMDKIWEVSACPACSMNGLC